MTNEPRQKPPVKRHLPPPKARVTPDMLDEKTVVVRFNRIRTKITIQTWLIAVLAAVFAAVVPMAEPAFLYYAHNPDGSTMRLTGMLMPNMTNQAILSWATTSITEIMTMGFGDMDVKVPKQRRYFTEDGWTAYIKALHNQKIGEAFKRSQLVLTTVPSNTPVITFQGINLQDVYQWNVQMPVVMTYATNNNVTTKKTSVVTMQIVRVPADQNPGGIAIQNWVMR